MKPKRITPEYLERLATGLGTFAHVVGNLVIVKKLQLSGHFATDFIRADSALRKQLNERKQA